VVNPKKRYSCEEILEFPVFKKRAFKYYPEQFTENQQYASNSNEYSFLLKTIKFPKNLSQLSNKLPKKNYTDFYSSREASLDTQHFNTVSSNRKENLPSQREF
jgi:hypothetical protein